MKGLLKKKFRLLFSPLIVWELTNKGMPFKWYISIKKVAISS